MFEDLPQLRWLLVGDDGQHDPSLYAEAVAAAPERVLGVAIRQLSTAEQVVSRGTPGPKDAAAGTGATSPGGPMYGSDGYALREELGARDIIPRAAPPTRA